MQCPRCRFENIPGQKKCIQCGTILELNNRRIDIYPRRVSKWKIPLRAFSRRLRQSKAKVFPDRDSQSISGLFEDPDTAAILGAFISVIPGLAHLINKQFVRAALCAGIWLILIVLAVFFYGTQFGALLYGLAIGIHVYIALQFGLLKSLKTFRWRLAAWATMIFFFLLVYQSAQRIIFGDYVGGFANRAYPYQQIAPGDFLIGRRSLATQEDTLLRGTGVLVRPETRGGRYVRYEQEQPAYAQVVGLPGESLVIENNNFFINGGLLDAEKYPVPEFLRKSHFSTKIDANSYFVSLEYERRVIGRDRGDSPTADEIKTIYMIPEGNIEAVAVLHWLPLSKRGIIQQID